MKLNAKNDSDAFLTLFFTKSSPLCQSNHVYSTNCMLNMAQIVTKIIKSNNKITERRILALLALVLLKENY